MKVGRVIDVISINEKDCRVIIIAGGEQYQYVVNDEALELGDIFLIAEDDPPALGRRIGRAEPGGWHALCDGLRWLRPMADGRTRMSVLWDRHAIRQVVRSYLDEEGFIEIDTPLLVRGTTPDLAIDSIQVGDRYLITSSEYQIKRMEVGGFERIYTLTSNFRKGDSDGPTRNPEFTMLEWARAGESLAAIENDVEAFVARAHFRLHGNLTAKFGGHTVMLDPPWDRMTVAQAIEATYGVPVPTFSPSILIRALQAANVHVRPEWQEDVPFLFSMLMTILQPHLGITRPVFLKDWPAFETSSAAQGSSDHLVDRSELFIAGVELADGFASLSDYKQQLAGFEQQQLRRSLSEKEHVMLDLAYLEALRAGLPFGAGMALGFDRLVMLLTGCTDIRQVLAFTWEEV